MEDHTIQWFQIMTDMTTDGFPYNKARQDLFLAHKSTLDKIFPDIPGTMCVTNRIITLKPTLIDLDVTDPISDAILQIHEAIANVLVRYGPKTPHKTTHSIFLMPNDDMLSMQTPPSAAAIGINRMVA